MSDDWITTSEAAEISSYHPEYVRRLLKEERVKGRKFGTVWQISRASLSDYLLVMKKKGERRGPKGK